MRIALSLLLFVLSTSHALACFNDSECSTDQLCQCPSTSATGACDTAGQCIPRGSEGAERAVLPFDTPEASDIPTYKAQGDETLENALSFVRFVNQGECGPRGFGGVFLAIENRHPSKTIWVTYGVNFFYQGRPRSETRTGRWSAGRVNPVGCTVPGPTSQRFRYSIISARF